MFRKLLIGRPYMTDKPLSKEGDLQIMDKIRESMSPDLKIRMEQKWSELPYLQLLKNIAFY